MTKKATVGISHVSGVDDANGLILLHFYLREISECASCALGLIPLFVQILPDDLAVPFADLVVICMIG